MSNENKVHKGVRTTDSKAAAAKPHEEQKNLATASANTGGELAVMNFAEDAGAGMENVDNASLAIPFINLLQGLSPQCETVDGAKPGLFINSITNELAKELLVIPCAFRREFIRWGANRGGFKGVFSPIDVETKKVPGMSVHGNFFLMDVPAGVGDVLDEKGKPKYDHLSDTRNHFVLVKSPSSGVWTPALVSLSSTQIKKSKRWMSRIQGLEMDDGNGRKFTPPSFSHVYVLKPTKEKNNRGQEWWGFEIDLVGPVTETDVYGKAKEFHKSVMAGKVETTPPEQAGGMGEDFEQAEGKF